VALAVFSGTTSQIRMVTLQGASGESCVPVWFKIVGIVRQSRKGYGYPQGYGYPARFCLAEVLHLNRKICHPGTDSA
jgi:hypothetical protein